MLCSRFRVRTFKTIAGDIMIDTEQVSEGRQTDEQPTYSVSTWDHENEKWEPRERRVSKWDLRRWLRRLYAESWDRVSILVERNG
jgi:aconitase A